MPLLSDISPLFIGRQDATRTLRRPEAVAEVFGLHPLAAEDTRKGHQHATRPLPDMLEELLSGADRHGTGDEVRNRLCNVHDRTVRVADRVDTARSLLENALTVHSTLVIQEQNEEMRRMSSTSLRLAEETIAQGEKVKRISSWAAILFTPTLVAGVYGMNFDLMPELHWTWGYPFAMALMLGLAVGLWSVFKWRRWL